MALYFVSAGDPPETVLLVRARNGHRALELTGMDNAKVARVTEAGDDGIIRPDGSVLGASRPDQPAKHQEGGAREIDITHMSDRGVRRFKNLDTGEERTEPRADRFD